MNSGGGKIVDGGSVNSGGGGDGKFLQLWRDNAAAAVANNITNDHDKNDGIIYLYLNLIESRMMIHNSKSFWSFQPN